MSHRIKNIVNFVLDVNKDVFQISLVTYLVFLLIEEFKKGFVTNNFNLNILLYLVIVSGIIAIFTEKKEDNERKPEASKQARQITKGDYFLIFGVGILGGVLIFLKTKDIGWISYIISIISSVLIVLLSILLFKDDEGGRQ